MKTTTKMASPSLPVLSTGVGLCVYFLLVTTHMNGVHGSDCVSLDVVYPVGSKWTERCRSCTCTVNGKQCTGPTCTLPYIPEHEILCAEWESNGCCCKAIGCKLSNGTIVDIGDFLPKDPVNPCKQCKCAKPSPTYCVYEQCPALACPGQVTPPGKCCPECTGCVLANGTTVDVGDLLPIDPSRPCEQCYCNTGVCRIEICPQLTCFQRTKPQGACCWVCAAPCTLPASVVNSLSPSETKPHEVDSFATFQSVNPNEVFNCFCGGPGQEAFCSKSTTSG